MVAYRKLLIDIKDGVFPGDVGIALTRVRDFIKVIEGKFATSRISFNDAFAGYMDKEGYSLKGTVDPGSHYYNKARGDVIKEPTADNDMKELEQVRKDEAEWNKQNRKNQ